MYLKHTFNNIAGWGMRTYRFFSSLPPRVHQDNYWFYNISTLAYFLIALVHVGWIFVFSAMGQGGMAYIQSVSIACYTLALFINHKGYHVAGMAICIAEVCAHQVIAVMAFGWGAGFQNFIPLVALLPFFKYNESWATKFVLVAGCMLCYLYLDVNYKSGVPGLTLRAGMMSWLSISNSVLSFVLVTAWGVVLAFSYQRAVSALIKKEQELFAIQNAREQADMLNQLELKERDNEIYHLRNIELRNSNAEITEQKQVIEQLLTEQEQLIHTRTMQIEEANATLIHANEKLLHIIQYNSHNIREPLTRIMMCMSMHEQLSSEEFYRDIWPHMAQAVQDLDNHIKAVVNTAERGR